MVALKYPQMFNGIISSAPSMDLTRLVAVKVAWLTQANADKDGKAILKLGKDELIGAEVMQQCDTEDGTEDGVIADPRRCSVNLSALKCEVGQKGASCLTDVKLDMIKEWRQSPRNQAGEQLYPDGVPEGSERFWWLWRTGRRQAGTAAC